MQSPISPLQPPQPNVTTHTTYQPEQDLLRLRRRLGDLLRLGGMTPETFQQTILQLWQEVEKRRQSCLHEAEDYMRKYQASLAQAGAFSAQSSILFAIINGFVTLEERRIQETADRAREAAEREAAQKVVEVEPPPPPPVQTPLPPPLATATPVEKNGLETPAQRRVLEPPPPPKNPVVKKAIGAKNTVEAKPNGSSTQVVVKSLPKLGGKRKKR
jgi:hypothetical protein